MGRKWLTLVTVPSLEAARNEARRWHKRADKVKIVKDKDGWYSVCVLNPSEGARIIFGL